MKKEELIKFSLIMFSFIFITSSIICYKELLDDGQWVSMSLYPAIILFSFVLVRFMSNKLIKGLTLVLFIYFIARSLYFVNISENFFAVPKDVLCDYYFNERIPFYIRNNKDYEAANRIKWFLRHCSNEGNSSIREIISK